MAKTGPDKSGRIHYESYLQNSEGIVPPGRAELCDAQRTEGAKVGRERALVTPGTKQWGEAGRGEGERK